MKKTIALLALSSLALGVTVVSAQTPGETKLKKIKKTSPIVPQKVKGATSITTQAGMESPEQLCGSNAVISSKTEKCNVTETQECRRRVAVCANASGQGGYTSSGECTDCVPKPTSKEPSEKETIN